MNFTKKINPVLLRRLLATGILIGLQSINAAALAADSTEVAAPRTPTPRLADGTVDLGGNGIWDLPYITNMASTATGHAASVSLWIAARCLALTSNPSLE